jgi:hypothetical protein
MWIGSSAFNFSSISGIAESISTECGSISFGIEIDFDEYFKYGPYLPLLTVTISPL